MKVKSLIDLFKQIYRSDEFRLFFAPGRINLIGEHTDYNGGHVFPCAIDRGTYCLARKRDDRLFRLYSANFQDKGSLNFVLMNWTINKSTTGRTILKG